MEEERLISEFNEAKFQIYRLHNLWVVSKSYREAGKLIDWKWTLDTAEIELSNDALRLDKETDEDDGIPTNWKSRIELVNKDIENAEEKKNMKELYKSLKNKEKLLRNLQEICGKGGKFRQADEDWDIE